MTAVDRASGVGFGGVGAGFAADDRAGRCSYVVAPCGFVFEDSGSGVGGWRLVHLNDAGGLGRRCAATLVAAFDEVVEFADMADVGLTGAPAPGSASRYAGSSGGLVLGTRLGRRRSVR